jgi:hypothetical protein
MSTNTSSALDQRQELQRLALPLARHTELSDAELRLAHAQLVGWLQGLLKTAQTALSHPHAVLATDWITGQAAEVTSTPSDIPASPNHLDQPHVDPRISTSCRPDDTAPDEDKPAIRSARHTLITAIIRRITQQRLTAAQAAAILHLTRYYVVYHYISRQSRLPIIQRYVPRFLVGVFESPGMQ